MYTGKVYRIHQLAIWTRFETMWFILTISICSALYYFLELESFRIPWTAITLTGTAVAFVIGFQNNSVYQRIWEARKIWGGVVNTSRTFGVFVQAMLTNDHTVEKVSADYLKNETKALTYRHIAWLTALRFSMRKNKEWEIGNSYRTNREWVVRPPEWKSNIEETLKNYLSESDLKYVMSKDNHQTAILYLQSSHIKKLKDQGIIWEFSFLELEGIIEKLFTLQGQSERIKNFPYPRQYATLNHYFMWMLLLLLPMALVPQFIDIGKEVAVNYPRTGSLFMWFSIPIYTALAWIFHTMERIGRTGENPFEGTSSDVPISTIARGIEIDLRQNLGENKDEIPAQFQSTHGVQF